VNIFLLILLGLTAVAIPVARGMAVKNGAALWDRTQKYNLYNLGWVVALFITDLVVSIVGSVPWGMALFLLAPVLAICIWSLIAAYDWDVSGNFGALMDKVAFGNSTSEAKSRLKVRRLVSIGVLGLLFLTWLTFSVITSADNNGTHHDDDAKPPASTSAPAPASPKASPSQQGTPSASASPSKSVDPNCGVPTNDATQQNYTGHIAKDANTIDVCVNGVWVSHAVSSGQEFTASAWWQDKKYTYVLLTLNGEEYYWTRTLRS
jgi:cytoskeletal protein RodZ